MLDATIVATSTQRACAGGHGAVQGAARIAAASQGVDEKAVIDSSNDPTPCAA
jgi:hypothetical protein